jgi:hypothetical protein
MKTLQYITKIACATVIAAMCAALTACELNDGNLVGYSTDSKGVSAVKNAIGVIRGCFPYTDVALRFNEYLNTPDDRKEAYQNQYLSSWSIKHNLVTDDWVISTNKHINWPVYMIHTFGSSLETSPAGWKIFDYRYEYAESEPACIITTQADGSFRAQFSDMDIYDNESEDGMHTLDFAITHSHGTMIYNASLSGDYSVGYSYDKNTLAIKYAFNDIKMVLGEVDGSSWMLNNGATLTMNIFSNADKTTDNISARVLSENMRSRIEITCNGTTETLDYPFQNNNNHYYTYE